MSWAGFFVGLVPLAAALAAIVAAYLTGFDQNLNLPAEIDSRFYGFFLDQYPLYAFAIVYALARIVTSAFAPGSSPIWRRLLGCLVGLILVLGVSLQPTFGGFVLRGGFMTGGVSFLNQLPHPLAYAAGTAVAAAIFGMAMGLGVVLVGRGWRDPVGRVRGWLRGLSGLASRYLVLWYGFAVLGAARLVGFGVWPKRPLDWGDALLAAACLVIGLLPHALLVGGRLHAAPIVEDRSGGEPSGELREAG